MATETQDAVAAFGAALASRDYDTLANALAPDAVFRSPNTNRLRGEGREQIAGMFGEVLGLFDDMRVTDEQRGAGTGAVFASARVEGTEVEMCNHLRLDADGRIEELTLFFRPLPSIAVAMRALATKLAGHKRPIFGKLAAAVVSPLVLYTRTNDKMVARLVRPKQ
jgi:hypothetical protein